MKVVIADDEKRVCQLISHLINWEELDMQVVAVVHNGLEVLETIEKYKPDIIITDIRMPGLDGLEMIRKARELDSHLEFIVISGYRHFEYAQNAIRYGARDYLLKPIKENELRSVLERMRKNYQIQHEQISREEKYKELIQNNCDRLRTVFFNDMVLKRPASGMVDTLDQINKTYYYEFQPGYFQIAIVKVDSIAFNTEENLDYIQKKIIELLGKKLKAFCYDREYLMEDSRCVILVNYMPEKELEIHKEFKSLINELVFQNDIFESMKVTVGLGSVEKEIGKIYQSMEAALWAMEQRLILGGNRVIEGVKTSSNDFAESKLFCDFNKNLSEALESLDKEMVLKTMQLLKNDLDSKQDLSGHSTIFQRNWIIMEQRKQCWIMYSE